MSSDCTTEFINDQWCVRCPPAAGLVVVSCLYASNDRVN
jgi:hypothetical protein